LYNQTKQPKQQGEIEIMSKASYVRLNRAKEALDSIAFDDTGQVKINHRLEAIKMILALIHQEKEENKQNELREQEKNRQSGWFDFNDNPCAAPPGRSQPDDLPLPLNREQRRRMEKNRKNE
jgi:acyl-CoA reductase-like NAD-dependent aldehyde dehydrogenase